MEEVMAPVPSKKRSLRTIFISVILLLPLFSYIYHWFLNSGVAEKKPIQERTLFPKGNLQQVSDDDDVSSPRLNVASEHEFSTSASHFGETVDKEDLERIHERLCSYLKRDELGVNWHKLALKRQCLVLKKDPFLHTSQHRIPPACSPRGQETSSEEPIKEVKKPNEADAFPTTSDVFTTDKKENNDNNPEICSDLEPVLAKKEDNTNQEGKIAVGNKPQGQGNGSPAEASSNGRNTSNGNVAHMPTCLPFAGSSHGGAGSGGSGGDENHPINIPRGHYEENPAPQLEKGSVLPDLDDDLAKHDDHHDDHTTTSDIPRKCDGNDDEPVIDVDVDVAENHGNFLDPERFTQGRKQYNFSLENQYSDSTLQPWDNRTQEPPRYKRYDGYKEGKEFTSIRLIGSGKFGRCYSCLNKTNGEDFVRKEVRRNEFEWSEVTIWRAILQPAEESPFIVQLYGMTENEGFVNMFMEHMDGTLEDLVNALSLSEKEVIALMKPVLLALDLIHQKNIVHGDIKCANIFFKENTSEIKVGDFGLALSLQDGLYLRFTKPRGTACCIPPEVCRSEEYGRSADIWAFACAIIHLRTGRAPWSEYGHHQQILFQVGSGLIPEIPAECSPYMREILESMFREKTKRPTARALLQTPLFTDQPGSPSLEETLQDVFFRLLELRLQEPPNLEYNDRAPRVDSELMFGHCSPVDLG